MITVKFNDTDLSTYFRITDIDRAVLPERTNTLISVGNSNGQLYKGFKLASRKISLDVVLLAESTHDLQKIKRELASVLCTDSPKKLIFSDEDDVYYLAVFDGNTEIDQLLGAGKGHITFVCPEPLAYSTNKETIELGEEDYVLNIDNSGTAETYPTYTVNMLSDNGFVGIINNDGRIIQIGDPDEIDGFVYEKSEYGIIDYCGINFFEPNYHSHGWKTNEGTVLEINGIKCDQTGEFEYGEYKVNYHQWAGKTFYNFHPKSYGEGDSWHGASMTRAFTPDSEGGDTAQNWSFEFQQHLITGKVAQVGMQQWLVNSPDGKNVAGYVFYKNSTSINDLIVCYVINGKIVHQFSTYAGIEGRWCGWSWGQWRIDKFGNTFVFTTPNGVWNFEDSEAGNIPAKYVTFYAAQYGNVEPCTINFFKGCKFEKHNVKKWQDIPNKFGSYDELTVDTSSGTIRVNGIERADLGAIGNDYFPLNTGENKITFVWSDWASKPKITVEYRKAWL